MRRIVLLLSLLLLPLAGSAQERARPTRADTLRGSIGPERAWWDVTFYDLAVRISPADSSVRGSNAITYRVVAPAREMQIDLMRPLVVDSMLQDGRRVSYRREGDVFFAAPPAPQALGSVRTLTVYYQGKPGTAVNPPWDGGFVWARDPERRPWVATAVQGLGASSWWPNKDTQAEEPDSQRIAVTVPSPMVNVSNGRLRGTRANTDGTTTYEWFVSSPINNYNVAVNAGSYAHFSDVYAGESGPLTLDYWPLASRLEQARRQFAQVKPMLACFESWFGPFPWYEDGFKLVETPYLGMEHQSAVAYGNNYMNGYLGRDLSGTGHGAGWDYIIVHESGHEWFGNNITTRDIADMWVHEGFTTYSEGIFVECNAGKQAGAEYLTGLRQNIENKVPIVGTYGVNQEGSVDMYYKGANMLHTIRQVIGDDARWRAILRGLNSEFRHQVVTGNQVQQYVSRQSGRDLGKVFEQYLTTTRVPVLEYRIAGPTFSYRWANVVPGFDMPVSVRLGASGYVSISPTATWKSAPHRLQNEAAFEVDPSFYVTSRRVN
ncbi:MAG: M1 family metallopeptidase [Gemmatimonadetes bacterium]|nr:M1 family metallopeptidase [Gemmatimonadota bacterium]